MVYITAIIVCPVLSYCISILAGHLVIPYIYSFFSWLNGAPFKTGDHVQVLCKNNYGKVGKIQQVGEYRGVKISVVHTDESLEIYEPSQLLKVAK